MAKKNKITMLKGFPAMEYPLELVSDLKNWIHETDEKRFPNIYKIWQPPIESWEHLKDEIIIDEKEPEEYIWVKKEHLDFFCD